MIPVRVQTGFGSTPTYLAISNILGESTISFHNISTAVTTSNYFFRNDGTTTTFNGTNMAFKAGGNTYMNIFTSGRVAVQNAGTFTDNGTQFQTTSISYGFAAKTTTYTVLATDHTLTGDATGAAFTMTLPTAVGCAGREYKIKKIDASANAVTVGTTSSQTIDGSTTYSLASQYKYVIVERNYANWIVVGNN